VLVNLPPRKGELERVDGSRSAKLDCWIGTSWNVPLWLRILAEGDGPALHGRLRGHKQACHTKRDGNTETAQTAVSIRSAKFCATKCSAKRQRASCSNRPCILPFSPLPSAASATDVTPISVLGSCISAAPSDGVPHAPEVISDSKQATAQLTQALMPFFFECEASSLVVCCAETSGLPNCPREWLCHSERASCTNHK